MEILYIKIIERKNEKIFMEHINKKFHMFIYNNKIFIDKIDVQKVKI